LDPNDGLRALDERALALGCCYDGMNPFGKYAQYSITVGQWVILNLPPHLRSVSKYVLCTGIQSGPGKSKNHETYMKHEVQKLLLLNKGVPAYDADRQENFTLYARMLFAIGDYPGTCAL